MKTAPAEVRGKTEAELQTEVDKLSQLAEARLRIWRSANALPERRRRTLTQWLFHLLRRRHLGRVPQQLRR